MTLVRHQRTRERHAAVHTLLNQGFGLLECARRLGWAPDDETLRRAEEAAGLLARRRGPAAAGGAGERRDR
ncbi:hypothetical protein [Dactylosporangium sp. CA-233914]|uniref:hypothetical protein n=1 Tax=Dactylosporangium sp. CA-233914 TaxID=3239934 RepID=UPI003D8A6545